MEYDQQGRDPPPVHDSTGGGDSASPESECDGLDNDGDGEVDEGFEDVDGDGVADCVDEACAVDGLEAEPLGESPACSIPLEPPADPWSVEVMWESSSEVGAVFGGAVIADLNQDGVSDVIFAGYYEIVALSGVDGSVLWTYSHMAANSPLAVADIDGDGTWNVLVLGNSRILIALNADGTVAWTGSSTLAELSFDDTTAGLALEVADLFGDGRAEVVAGFGIASAETGVTERVFEEAWSSNLWLPTLAVADLDGDGQQESVLGAMQFDAMGSPVAELSLGSEASTTPVPALIQADADPAAELALVSYDGWFALVDDNAEMSVTERISSDRASTGLSCAGDIDGDGVFELVLPTQSWIRALELDGTVIWELPLVDDTIGYIGCSLFDFDGDGADDVLVGDMEDFRILDGRTGAVRFQDPLRKSFTGYEIPMVADLDGDGSVEIIVPSACGGVCEGDWADAAIRVYRNTNRDWPPGSPIWPSATWSGTSMFLDGSIPRTPEPAWLTTEVWRGQPETMLSGWDLRPEITSSCASSCDPEIGRVNVALRLANLGPQEVQRGAPIAVYGLDADGTPSLLEVCWFHEFIDNGWASATVDLELKLEQAQRGILLVAGDDGSGGVVMEDCDQDNNTLSWRHFACD